MAAMLLADYGADVVKVEPPSGDPARALTVYRQALDLRQAVASADPANRTARWAVARAHRSIGLVPGGMGQAASVGLVTV